VGAWHRGGEPLAEAGGGAGGYVQFREDRRHVMADRLGRYEKLRRDLPVGVLGADQVEDLALAAGQPERAMKPPSFR